MARKCDDSCKGCPKCIGEKEIKGLKDFMKKNAELVFPHTFMRFRCLENEETLENLGEIMLHILRGALLGRMKFTGEDWAFIMECVWEQRALEVVRGTKWALMHELCRSTWESQIPFKSVSIGEHFATKVRKIIRIILETAPDDEITQVLREEMSYYDPSGENDRRYMEGRFECMDIDGTNTMIASVGGYHSIRRGKIRKGYKVIKNISKYKTVIHFFRVINKCKIEHQKSPKPMLPVL